MPEQFIFEYHYVEKKDLEVVYFANAIRLRTINNKIFGYMKTN